MISLGQIKLGSSKNTDQELAGPTENFYKPLMI